MHSDSVCREQALCPRQGSDIGAEFRSSLPGLTRQSIHLRKKLLAKTMDARVISAFTRVFDALLPAHD
jgi:hypothetical protein